MKRKTFIKPDPFELALWGLVVAAVVGLIYFLQLRAMQRQNVISLKALESQERAWVSFSANLTPVYIWDPNDPTKILRYSFGVPMKNSGTTVPMNLKGQAFAKIWPNPLPDNTFDFQDLQNGIPLEIGPQDQITYRTNDNVTVDDLEKVRAGQHLYIYGWATYNDIFDDTPQHITKFCFEVRDLGGDFTTTNGKWNLWPALCKDHNCADQECSK